MIINNNMNAMGAHRNMSFNTTQTGKAMEKLSSGLRINRAGDDAAGLAISEKMRGQIRGLDQATRNSQDGISLIQTAEGALNETHSILQRMRELSVQSSNDTATNDDRKQIQAEVDQLAGEITRVSNTTEFNTKNLLAGGLDSTFHIGANASQNIKLAIGSMDAQSLGVAGNLVTTSFTNTNTGVSAVETTSENLNGLYVSVTKSVATSSAVTKSDASAGDGTANVSAYTGSTATTYQVRVTGETGGKVTSAEYSTDGGTTWSNAAVDSTATNGVATLSNGATLTIATNGANSNGDSYTFTANPETLSMQLNTVADGSGTRIGDVVTVNNRQSSVVIGSKDSNQSATVKFDFNTVKAAIGTAGTYEGDAITQTVQSSTAAVVGADGSVTTEAVVKKGINVSTQSSADKAITTINTAIEKVSSERSKLGAVQNRLEHTINNLSTSAENLQAAESRIRDVDMAKEMMNFTKNNILNQAAQAMLAQAKSQPEAVLQLLR